MILSVGEPQYRPYQDWLDASVLASAQFLFLRAA